MVLCVKSLPPSPSLSLAQKYPSGSACVMNENHWLKNTRQAIRGRMTTPTLIEERNTSLDLFFLLVFEYFTYNIIELVKRIA
jgi:hypothetical protein